MSRRSKTITAARFKRAPATLTQIREQGFDAQVLSEETGHVRITGSGVKVDFWITTERWKEPKPGGRGGNGLQPLIAFCIAERAAVPPEPSMMLPLVTLFADASYSHRTRNGGWAAWGKGPGSAQGVTWSGPLRPTRSSQQAEFLALMNGIACANREGLLPMGEFNLMLQSDCIEALSMILWLFPAAIDKPVIGGHRVSRAKRPSASMRDCPGFDWLKEFVAGRSVNLIVRHVKGHAAEDGSRHSVNRLCDKLAKAERKRLDKAA